MGKSTVAAMFAEAGVPVFDADQEVRAMQGPGGMLVAAIGDAFPDARSNGELDRSALAQRVLLDPAALARLESIVHPALARKRIEFLERNRHSPAVLFDLPLLFETGAGEELDAVVVVSAPAEVQRNRALSREGMDEERLEAILRRQLPDAEKRRRADFVIETGGDLSTTKAAVGKVLACLGLLRA